MAVSIAPSQYWEGNDGPWSTFALQIGTSPQTIRVLPSSSGSSVWAVLPEGCGADLDPDNCDLLRGLFFDPQHSASFQRHGDGFFELPFEAEAELGYTGNALIGYDNVTLGWPGSGAPELQGQVVYGFATKDTMLGLLGLTSRPVNLTDFSDARPSPLSSLKAAVLVKSAYWAYTAGMRYHEPSVYGSLTFGGYDAMRGNMTNAVTVPLGVDTDRDILLKLNSITISGVSGSVPIPESTIVYIDSTVPYIWLPLSTCAALETAFGLQWNETVGMYLVNETHHQGLVDLNPTVAFSLQAPGGGTDTSIVLPYSAFDLEASYPLAGIEGNETVKYFPLMRADNSSQYVLGRTFLQEAYLAVDYDRSEFRITQALIPSDASAQNIQVVQPPGEDPQGIGAGAIAGIVVSMALLLLALAGVAWLVRRRRRRKREQQRWESAMAAAEEHSRLVNEKEQSKISRAELDATGTATGNLRERQELSAHPEAVSNGKPGAKRASELEDSARHEMAGLREAGELPAERESGELSGQNFEPRERFELP